MLTVAIVGRPNVGKSTLFNRLIGKKLALVHDSPGLTRDWRETEANFMGLTFNLVDTAGLEESFDASIQARMRRQTEAALDRADFVFFVVDARSGITPMDHHFADFLRRRGTPTALLVNKCESEKAMAGMFEAYELGFGDPIPVSAEHGRGMSDIFDLLRPLVEAAAKEGGDEEAEEDVEALLNRFAEGSETGFGDLAAPAEDLEKPIKIAIVGRPNAGKSTLMNTLLGEERSMTGPEAGITRDAVHADFAYVGRKLRLVDTAGLRKRARVVDDIEHMSAQDSLRAIRLAHVVILVIDGEKLFERQDVVIGNHVMNEGRALVIAVNKWDLVADKTAALEELRYQAEKSLAQSGGVALVTLSALTGQRVEKVLDAALGAYAHWNSRVSTSKLNRWLKGMESQNPAPMVDGRPNRLRYVTQVKARPPTFAIWVSRPGDLPDSYQRYLVNGIRKTFDLPAVPVRFVVRTSKNPYQD